MTKVETALPKFAVGPQPQFRSFGCRLLAILLILIFLNVGSLLSSRKSQTTQLWRWHHASVLSEQPSIDTKHPLMSQSKFKSFQQCSIDNFMSTGLSFLKDVKAPDADEFATRRDRLAEALHQDGLDAFVAEPGFTFQYYVNISQTDWEPWEPEERPFLMIVRPIQGSDGTVSANTSFLAPAFEAERVRLLGMPFNEPLAIVEWEEHWNPYATLVSSATFNDFHSSENPTVMVDDEMRDYIQRGLGQNGFDVVGLGGNVEAVRQTKSPLEVKVLRAVNTGTVEAIRQMRKCLYPGLTESEIRSVLDATLAAGGLDPFFDLVLFDEDAANPHGGTNGTKVLTAETFVLIDVGAHLYGYSSDVTRTFVPPFLPRNGRTQRGLREKMTVWNVVLLAQTASIDQFRPGNTAASVDISARQIISDSGYEAAFTHRLGHGIGIKAHESPYLNKGNHNVTLRAGMTFTSEPGVYLVDKFGVRHEDVFLVKEEGKEPECLSGRRATDPWYP